MIVQLTVENFKSCLESTSIDFQAGKARKLSGNLLQLPNKELVVKSMALFGKNASGKTTILDALYALKMYIDFSSRDQKPTARIPGFEPFLLDDAASKRPARIAVTFDLGKQRFTLDVAATSQHVSHEKLVVQRISRQPSRKWPLTTLLNRSWDTQRNEYSTQLHPDLGTQLMLGAAREQTPANRLVIGKLASLNSEVASRIIQWFDEDLFFYDMHRNQLAEDLALSATARRHQQDPDFAAMLNRLSKDADTGIQSLAIDTEASLELVASDEGKKPEITKVNKPTILFRHFAQDGSEVYFGRQQESSGTRRFIAMLTAILQPCGRRRLVCIDELSASMHPDLVCRLIQIMHSKLYNPKGHQILFTTHDTHLMDPNTLLRRDQITICYKNRFGRSWVKRLDEFQDEARSDSNLQKQYLDDRFGGLPRFGPSLEDVEADDKPLEICS